jgi:hypothetical protein
MSDEDRPRRKRTPRDEEDGDDEVRSRRRRRDEDEDDPSPDRLTSRGNQGGKGLIVGLSIGGGILLLGVVVLLVLLLGGFMDGPDAVVGDYIKINQEMSDIFDTIKDPSSAREAAPRLQAIAAQLQVLGQRSAKLKMEDKKQAKEKRKSEVEQSIQRMQGASGRAMMNAKGDKDFMMATSFILNAQAQLQLP